MQYRNFASHQNDIKKNPTHSSFYLWRIKRVRKPNNTPLLFLSRNIKCIMSENAKGSGYGLTFAPEWFLCWFAQFWSVKTFFCNTRKKKNNKPIIKQKHTFDTNIFGRTINFSSWSVMLHKGQCGIPELSQEIIIRMMEYFWLYFFNQFLTIS